MKKYETVTISCTLSTIKSLRQKVQNVLDDYAAKGWRLHTADLGGSAPYVCLLIFEKDEP